ncbi:MAG: hypothetical protein RL215_1822, partial [Planctomycetota bacterium]
LAETTSELRILARQEWGGFPAMAELLAAFVLPNDPALPQLLRSASHALQNNDHPPALDGYQSNDPARAHILTAAVWSAVSTLQLTYANPPASFESSGQKVRFPADVVHSRLATCLDSTLLFAATLEAVGLNPVVVIQKGHCFAGVWITRRSFAQPVEQDPLEVRKALHARELLLFETTLITHRPAAKFEQARLRAEQQLELPHDPDFVAAIDIHRCRLSRILPLASHRPENTQSDDPQHSSELLPLPPLPSPDLLPVEIAEERPSTPEGRIQRWQRKLLDLSLRNRLLNFRPGKHGVSLACPPLHLLEDQLASGQPLIVVSLPELHPRAGRDPALHLQTKHEDLDRAFTTAAIQRGELVADLPRDELKARLTDLYRRSRNDLAEGGSNTLFLVMGFLRWKKSPEDETVYSAPLLLVPVRLTRASAVSGYNIVRHEDETRFNSTLLQLIRRDFEKDLTWLENSLPNDSEGVDVARILHEVRAGIRDIPGFEVTEEAALATFSFVRYLMWKDLADRIDHLRQNRVVRHLVENPEQPFSSGTTSEFPRSSQLDQQYNPHDLVHPLPADSSQLAAMAAAAEGHDFVLIGPPGTGKSQTIANTIAQCLARKKTVLFVAEKTAALEVVHRRLQQNGLGELCLELHSSRAERRRFLQQMQDSWAASTSRHASKWTTINNKLKKQRDELNLYVETLHREAPSGWTIFRALGIVVANAHCQTPTLNWPDSTQHSKAAWEELQNLTRELAITFQSLEGSQPPQFLRSSEWTPVWETQLLQQFEALETSANQLRQSLHILCETIGCNSQQDASAEGFEGLGRAARCLATATEGPFLPVFEPDFPKLAAATQQLLQQLTEWQAARKQAAADYPVDSLQRIPVDALDKDWREASIRFWPLSVFARRRVRKLLQTYAANGSAQPDSDLPALLRMQTLLKTLANHPEAHRIPGWNNTQTDPKQLAQWLKTASRIHESLLPLQHFTSDLPATLAQLAKLLQSDSEKKRLKSAAENFARSLAEFSSAIQNLRNVAGGSPANRNSTTLLHDTLESAALIRSQRPALRRWTSWHSIRSRCESHGLTSFVNALEKGTLNPQNAETALPIAYARWWLPLAFSREKTLSRFRGFSHEAAINEFRKLDADARHAAATHVAQSLERTIPAPDQVSKQSELGILRHQMQLQRPSRSIRELVSAMPETFAKLAPCVLMSPLSIAQYLPANQQLFDIVIFDEASQITTWDAIGAIARGRQTIIVGDPKQLPPTSFFSRAEPDQDSPEIEDYERDLESILDEARASGLPTLQLSWHYRSQHESLIAFSNWHYYENKLLTFPSAVTRDQAVKFRFVPNGIFDRGGSRTNRIEADAVIADAVQRMLDWLRLPEEQRPTLGLITFNQPQQKLLEDLFDKAREQHPELEWFFDDARVAPTIVKNLENVQGDERDVILFSIAFGFDQTGRLTRNFGALNRDGGQRRLNVAVTRARQEMIVYSSFRAEQLSIDGV